MIEPWAEREIDWERDGRNRAKHLTQRGERGFSDYDAWSFDTYIAAVIANYAEHERNHGLGHPGDITEEEWHQMLSDIEIGFTHYAEQKFDDEFDVELFQRAMALFVDRFPDFWD